MLTAERVRTNPDSYIEALYVRYVEPVLNARIGQALASDSTATEIIIERPDLNYFEKHGIPPKCLVELVQKCPRHFAARIDAAYYPTNDPGFKVGSVFFKRGPAPRYVVFISWRNQPPC